MGMDSSMFVAYDSNCFLRRCYHQIYFNVRFAAFFGKVAMHRASRPVWILSERYHDDLLTQFLDTKKDSPMAYTEEDIMTLVGHAKGTHEYMRVSETCVLW